MKSNMKIDMIKNERDTIMEAGAISGLNVIRKSSVHTKVKVCMQYKGTFIYPRMKMSKLKAYSNLM